jgi:hypothetical protein
LKDQIIKFSIEKGVEVVTGLKMNIRSLNVGIFHSAVRIKGLRIFNPPQFKDRVMMDMPEIYVDYDLPAIFGGNVHLKELRLNLKELIVVKNAKGELNLNSLKVVKAKNDGVKPEAEGGKAPNMQIDSLDLKIGRAVYKDYTASPSPSVKEFNVNIDEHYANITNPYAVVSIIVVKALANTAIAGLANFDLNGLQGTVMDSLAKYTGVSGKATDLAKKALQATTGNASPTMKNASDTVGKAASAISGLFGGAGSDNK